jgi:hypothetical protein
MKLTVGQDLDPVYQLFGRLRRNFPQHCKSTNKLMKTVDRHITEYNNYLWLKNRLNEPRYLERAQGELDKISELLTVVEKQELMAILSTDQIAN